MEDDQPALSDATQAALASFLAERQARQQGGDDPFAEDWGMSQFWYTAETARAVAGALLKALGARGGRSRTACLACPSLFRCLRSDFPAAPAHLFEFDKRFAVLDDFTFYDYRAPEEIPEALRGAFAAVALDPPYLSEECLELSAQAVALLRESPSSPVVLLTGAVMRAAAERLLGLRPVAFRPQHSNKLGNEFLLYTNDGAVAAACGGWDEELLLDPT